MGHDERQRGSYGAQRGSYWAVMGHPTPLLTPQPPTNSPLPSTPGPYTFTPHPTPPAVPLLTRTVWFLMLMVGMWVRRNSVAVPSTFTRSKLRYSWGRRHRGDAGMGLTPHLHPPTQYPPPHPPAALTSMKVLFHTRARTRKVAGCCAAGMGHSNQMQRAVPWEQLWGGGRGGPQGWGGVWGGTTPQSPM